MAIYFSSPLVAHFCFPPIVAIFPVSQFPLDFPPPLIFFFQCAILRVLPRSCPPYEGKSSSASPFFFKLVSDTVCLPPSVLSFHVRRPLLLGEAASLFFCFFPNLTLRRRTLPFFPTLILLCPFFFSCLSGFGTFSGLVSRHCLTYKKARRSSLPISFT